MLSQKQIKMLELLDKQILSCTDCNLHKTGRCKPYWTPEYKGYFIIGEAPGKQEIEKNEPFIGTAGNHLWNIFDLFGISKKHCFLINSANCRPVNGNKNGKPSESHREMCGKWLRKYFKILQPKKILTLGNFPMSVITGEWGINKFYENNKLESEIELFDQKTIVTRSLHPSNVIYRGEMGKEKIIKSVSLFTGKDIIND